MKDNYNYNNNNYNKNKNQKQISSNYREFIDALYNASHNGNVELIRLIIDDFYRCNDERFGPNNVYNNAPNSQPLSLVDFLAAKSESDGGTGYNALQIASQNGFINCVEYLIELVKDERAQKFDFDEALINLINEIGTVNGDTALDAACRNYRTLIAKMLIDNGAKVNCRNSHGPLLSLVFFFFFCCFFLSWLCGLVFLALSFVWCKIQIPLRLFCL